MNKEKVYSVYDCECIMYLSIEIPKMLLLEERGLYIDLYYNTILEIYEDYKKYDDNSKSLLDSIHAYVDSKEKYILDKVKKCFQF